MAKDCLPKAETRIARDVRFLGEQDGPTERAFKRKLVPLLRASDVQRSYLARVEYEMSTPYAVAVCIVAREAQEDLVLAIGRLFSSMFGADQYLDILFVDSAQEASLSLACRPFFDSESHTWIE